MWMKPKICTALNNEKEPFSEIQSFQRRALLTVIKKVVANDMKSATTWSERGDSNARSLEPKQSEKIFSGDL